MSNWMNRALLNSNFQLDVEGKLQSVASQMINLDWKEIYVLPRQTVISISVRMFQYHLLSNILYCNKCLHKMKLEENPLCSQCKTVDDTSFHFLVLVLLLYTLGGTEKVVKPWDTIASSDFTERHPRYSWGRIVQNRWYQVDKDKSLFYWLSSIRYIIIGMHWLLQISFR